MTDTRINSSSDARTGNNSTRQTYRILSDDEKAAVDSIKQMGASLIEALHVIGGTDPAGDRMASRDLALAQTHIEDGVMRAIRHITA